MVILETKKGNVLDAVETHVVQQCNCFAVKPHGLSSVIAKRFPWANVYERRTPVRKGRNCASDPDVPGTIRVDADPAGGDRRVVHLFAQVLPGKPGMFARYYPERYGDSFMHRTGYFRRCLRLLEDLGEDVVFAVPKYIGCGLAGGHWPHYEGMLHKSKAKFVLYEL